MDRRPASNERYTSISRGIAFFVALIGVVSAVVSIVALPSGPLLKGVIIAGIVMISASFIVGYEMGRRRPPLIPASGDTVVVRTYPRSQHPEFFADVEHHMRTASRIILIAMAPNMLWEKHILDLLIERAQLRNAQITICMGNPKSPHVLDRLVEEEMGENRPTSGRALVDRTIQTLMERLGFAGSPSTFEVLLFEHYLTFATLIFDRQIFIYPYAYQVLGNASPIFQIADTGSPESKFFTAHAQRVLHDAIPARDFVQVKRNQKFYSTNWKNAAVFLIPDRETDLYRAGSSVLGYDIWTESEMTADSTLAEVRSYVGEAKNFGFHVTLADALSFCNEAGIERIKAELRMLSEDFPSVSLRSFDLVDGFGEADIVALKVLDGSGTLEAIHHELVARVYTLSISSTYRAGKTRKRIPEESPRGRLMVSRYGAPYILGQFNPHFTLCSAMPPKGSERDAAFQKLQSMMEPCITGACEIGEIALVVRDEGSDRWRVLETFPLRG